jgi:hypothetical protein
MRSVQPISIGEVIFALDPYRGPYRGMVRAAHRGARRQSPDLAGEAGEKPVCVAVRESNKAAVSVRVSEGKSVVPIRVRREEKEKHAEEMPLVPGRHTKPKPKYLGSEFIEPPLLMARR